MPSGPQETMILHLKMAKGERTCQSREESGFGQRRNFTYTVYMYCTAAQGWGNLGCLQKYDRLPVLRVIKHLSPYFSQLLTFSKGALKEGQGVGWKDLDDPPTDFALKLPSFIGCGEQERRQKDKRMKKEVGVPLRSQ